MRIVVVLLVWILTFCVFTPVSADIAPPAEPPGANPVPGNATTQVRMLEETVRIDIQAETRADSLGQAKVTAQFLMRNVGETDERMAVRFPLGTPDGWGQIAVIDKIDVIVDGSRVNTRMITGGDPTGTYEEVPWTEFDVVFPVEKNVNVSVEYMLDGAGELPYIWFNYIFSSGAAWKDSIEKADLIVTFPYAVNDLFLLHCIDNLYNCTVPGGVIKGREITWTYTDFEPQPEDNFMIALVAPAVWQQVLAEEERVAVAPGDGEAWGRLGRLYKSLIFSPHGWRGFRNYYYLADPGVEQLFQLADRAYTQAVTRLPEDALWHAGYAELLGYYAEFAGYEGVDTLLLKLKALQELHFALELSPEDEVVNEIAYSLSWPLSEGLVENENGFDFPWLTATPVATDMQTDQVEVTATLTPFPTRKVMEQPEKTAVISPPTAPVEATAAQETPTHGSDKPPICAGAILLPFGLMILGKMGHNWGRKI